MVCDFTSLSTLFQSYQNDGRVIMKSCVQWNPVYEVKGRLRRGLVPGLLEDSVSKLVRIIGLLLSTIYLSVYDKFVC